MLNYNKKAAFSGLLFLLSERSDFRIQTSMQSVTNNYKKIYLTFFSSIT